MLETLLPYVISISWTSSHISHPSMLEFNRSFSGLIGADLFQLSQNNDSNKFIKKYLKYINIYLFIFRS